MVAPCMLAPLRSAAARLTTSLSLYMSPDSYKNRSSIRLRSGCKLSNTDNVCARTTSCTEKCKVRSWREKSQKRRTPRLEFIADSSPTLIMEVGLGKSVRKGNARIRKLILGDGGAPT